MQAFVSVFLSLRSLVLEKILSKAPSYLHSTTRSVAQVLLVIAWKPLHVGKAGWPVIILNVENPSQSGRQCLILGSVELFQLWMLAAIFGHTFSL